MNVPFIVLVLTEIISLITNTDSLPRWKWTQKPHQNPWLRNPSEQGNDCVRGQCVQSWKCPPQAISRESSGGCAHWGNRPWVCCIVDYDENIHSRQSDYHPHEDHHNHPHVNHHEPHDDYHNHPHETHHNHPHEDHHYGHDDHYNPHDHHFNPHDDHHDPHEEHHHSHDDPACETHFTTTTKVPNNNWNYKTTKYNRGMSVTKRTTPNPPNTRTNKPKSTTNPRVRFPSWTQRNSQFTTAKPWEQPVPKTRSPFTRQTTRAVWSGNGGRNPTRASNLQPTTSRTRAPPSKSTIRGRERVTTPLPNVNTYLCGIRQPKPRSDRRSRSYDAENSIALIEGSHNISRRQVLARIVGGEEAEPFTWPWVAALYKVQSSGRNRFLCAGSLINENFVLTAAHSFTRDDVKSSSYVVMLGTHNAQDAVAQYRVSSILQHPRYESRLYYHDIALLRLERHVIFNEYVMPVCLPSPGAPLMTDRDLEGKTVTVMGWGDESFGGKSSRVLKEASFKIVSRRACNASYVSVASNRFPRGITNDMLCAGDPNGGKDACQGDSGGPLTSIERGRYTQVGVVSFGYQCGTKDFPGVYTKVSPYLSWIAENSQKARVDHDHDYDHDDYHDDHHDDDYRT